MSKVVDVLEGITNIIIRRRELEKKKKSLEGLRVRLIMIASEHGIGVRGQHPIETIARLRGVNLSQEDEAIVKQICEFYGVDPKRLRKRSG